MNPFDFLACLRGTAPLRVVGTTRNGAAHTEGGGAAGRPRSGALQVASEPENGSCSKHACIMIGTPHRGQDPSPQPGKVARPVLKLENCQARKF